MESGDAVNQASSQPKIISGNEIVQQNAEGLKQDKDDNSVVTPGTILSNQVVEPMSRGNGMDENPTAAARANMGPGEEANTSPRGAESGNRGTDNFSENFTRENLSNECCGSLLQYIVVVLSTTQPIRIRFDDFPIHV
ncbi:hypothetical protein AgCh_020499 [Apium graveolens]